MSDIFREVDEELRQEQYKRLWDKFGPYVVGVAVLIVVVTAGYRGWQAWQASEARDAGDRFVSALTLADEGDPGAASSALSELSFDSPSGYAALATLRAASMKAQSQDVEGALEAYAAIAADTSIKPILRNAARIRAGYLLVDSDDPSKVAGQVEAWRSRAMPGGIRRAN